MNWPQPWFCWKSLERNKCCDKALAINNYQIIIKVIGRPINITNLFSWPGKEYSGCSCLTPKTSELKVKSSLMLQYMPLTNYHYKAKTKVLMCVLNILLLCHYSQRGSDLPMLQAPFCQYGPQYDGKNKFTLLHSN